MPDLTQFSLSTGGFPIDWIVIAVFACVVALETFRAGSNRAAALALALPAALMVLAALPTAFFIGPMVSQFSGGMQGAVLFSVVLFGLFILIHKMFGFYGDSSGSFFQALIAGIATAAIAIVVWLQEPALQALWHFGPQVQAVFAEAYRFWWILLAYIALAVSRL